MPCAAADCALEDDTLAVQPCVACQRAVHHVCSNQFFNGDLSKRFCSGACVRVYRTLEGGEYADATAGSFDADGVPAHLSHSSPHRARDLVWSVIHVLKTSYARVSKSGAEQTKTHVCLLCTRDVAKQGRSATHWMSGLYNMPSTSNAKTHIMRAHKKHPIAVAIAKGDRETASAKRKKKTRRTAADDASEEGDEDFAKQALESDGDEENAGANDEPVIGGVSADGSFDTDGVPVRIGHSKPVKARDPVWSVIHTLKTPFVRVSKSGVERTKTHVCLLCTRDVAKQGRSETQWTSGLYNMPSTSNAKTHVLRAHKKHPVTVAVAAAAGNQATAEDDADKEAADQVSDGDEEAEDNVGAGTGAGAVSGSGTSAAGTFEADDVVFDSDGVPVHISHSSPHRARDPVWSVIHTLKTPFVRVSKSGVERTKTHVCLLCTRDVARQGRLATQWMSGLYNMPSTSNAKTHVLRAHSKYAEPSEAATSAEREVEQSPKKTVSHLGKRQVRERKAAPSVSQEPRPPPAKKKDLTVVADRTSSELVNAMIVGWLIEDGLPFETVTSTAFRDMMTTATGDTDLTIMSSDSFDLMLDAQFELFASALKNFLSDQQARVHGEKFLSLIHDVQKDKNGSVVGASVALIDHQWQSRRIALLASAKNDDGGHLGAVKVTELVEERAKDLYAVDVESMAKFVVSDTTSSAQDVAIRSPEAQRKDRDTRLLDQCIAYGVGLKEDTTSTQTYDAIANTLSTLKVVITPGGPLPQGASAIQKLRALNDYFCDEERVEALSRIQSALSLPVIGPLTDANGRQAASPCLLMRRSVLNYVAMREYFETVERLADDPFSCITSEDWQLVCEMEGATNFLSELAQAEAQNESSTLASFMTVFQKMAESELKCESFQCLTLATPKASTDETNQERVVVPLEYFSLPGKVCVERCLRQLESRFPSISPEEIMLLLLDPRTKDVAASIVDDVATSGIPADSQTSKARGMLAKEHLRVFKAMRSKEASSSSGDTASSEDTRDAVSEPSARSRRRSFLFGAPVPITHDKEAEVVLQRWIDLDVDWARVAAEQSTTGTSEAELRRLMSVKQGRSVVWDLLELYRQVDILRWFREEGEKSFPSVALLARIWLGKVSSSAFYDRVFSTTDGGITVDPKHTRAENARAEKQLLLQHNRDRFPRPAQVELVWKVGDY